MTRCLLLALPLLLAACKTDCERFNTAVANCSAAAGASLSAAAVCASAPNENAPEIDCAANAIENSYKSGACSTAAGATAALRSTLAACGIQSSADTGAWDTGYTWDTGSSTWR